MLNRLPALLITLLTIASCGAPPADIIPYERPNGTQHTPPAYEMVTLATDTNAALGESLTVRCLLMLGDDFSLPNGPVTVEATPAVESIEITNEQIHIVPATAGSLRVACRTADGTLVDPIGVTFEVDGYLPATWTVEIPERDCFGQTDTLDVDYSVQDALGNPVNRAEIDVAIQPNSGFIGNTGTGFRFTEDGEYDVTVSLIGEVDPEHSTIEPVQFSIRVDATPPVFEITSPTRGATLEQGGEGDSLVSIIGTVQDSASPITSLEANETEIPVSGNELRESFTASQFSRWGMNVASAHAEDACGNVAYVSIPYLRSPSYYPAATSVSSAAAVSGALAAQVSQTMVDDGDRSDLDDLASFGQAILDNNDFDAMLAPGSMLSTSEPRDDCDGFPGPTFVSTGHVAWRHPDAGRELNIDATVDHLSFVNGGVDFGVQVEDFDFPLRVEVTVIQCAVGAPTIDEITVNAWVGLDRLHANGVVGANLAGGRAAATVEAIDFGVEGLYLDIECGALDWACDNIADLVIGAAEGMVEQEVAEAVTEMVPPLLTDTLDSVTVETGFNLPAPLSTRVNVAAGLEQLTFCGADAGLPTPGACHADNSNPGAMMLGLTTQVYPSSRGAGIDANARGPIRSASAAAPQFSSATSSFGVGINRDALNQALWAVWYGGGLDIPDLRAGLPIIPESIDGSVNAGLPPVIMPGRNGNLIEVGIGDLQVEGSIDVNALLGDPEADPYYVDVSLTLSVLAGAAVTYQPETKAIELTLDPDPEFYFEIHQINDHTYGQVLGERLADLLARSLGDLLGEALSTVQVPSFDLSGVAGLPTDTVLGLSNGQATYQDGYVTVSGSIAAF